MKDSLYEDNFKLHSDNARLRKKLEQLESSLGIDRLRAHFEAEIQKQLRREEKLKKETDRYHRLWQDAVSELRSKGDTLSSSGSSWKTCRNSVTPYFSSKQHS